MPNPGVGVHCAGPIDRDLLEPGGETPSVVSLARIPMCQLGKCDFVIWLVTNTHNLPCAEMPDGYDVELLRN
jgi:hypothetical protein